LPFTWLVLPAWQAFISKQLRYVGLLACEEKGEGEPDREQQMIARRLTLLRRIRVHDLRGEGHASCNWLSSSCLQSAQHFHTNIACEGPTDTAISPEDGTEDRDKSYIDRLKVTARAGSGGNGCVSFWRSIARGEQPLLAILELPEPLLTHPGADF
jgi:hypothetical protein